MRIPLIPNTVILLVVLLTLMLATALHAGYVKARLMPFPTINIEKSWGMIGWRLAGLKRDKQSCRKVMSNPSMKVTHVKDNRLKNGCGWVNAVRLSSFAGAAISPIKLSCPMGAGLGLWMAQVVQPAAKKYFGSTVKRVHHLGGYSCRNIRGSLFSKYIDRRSEHATANAIDISSFTLANGKAISILRHWTKGGNEAKFLKEIHYGACSYFRVVLGPEANRLHANHFHFDRGLLLRCK